jgi:hypothetical protein
MSTSNVAARNGAIAPVSWVFFQASLICLNRRRRVNRSSSGGWNKVVSGSGGHCVPTPSIHGKHPDTRSQSSMGAAVSMCDDCGETIAEGHVPMHTHPHPQGPTSTNMQRQRRKSCFMRCVAVPVQSESMPWSSILAHKCSCQRWVKTPSTRAARAADECQRHPCRASAGVCRLRRVCH